jgi:hypothetical protein
VLARYRKIERHDGFQTWDVSDRFWTDTIPLLRSFYMFIVAHVTH